MADSLSALVTLGAGFAFGWIYRSLLWPRELPPLVLRADTPRYDFTPPVRVPPTGHYEQWRLYTHRYLCLAEVLERERGTRPGWLPSYQFLREKTGGSSRTFEVYDALLAQRGLIVVVNRGGRRWRVGKADRRAALATLAYPFPSRPPRFDFTR